MLLLVLDIEMLMDVTHAHHAKLAQLDGIQILQEEFVRDQDQYAHAHKDYPLMVLHAYHAKEIGLLIQETIVNVSQLLVLLTKS
jgi:hypothetical protein